MSRVVPLALMVAAVVGMTDDLERIRAIPDDQRATHINAMMDRGDGTPANDHYAEALEKYVYMFEMAMPADGEATDVEARDRANAIDSKMATLMLGEWDPADRDFVVGWLDRNREALEAIRRATAAERYVAKMERDKPLLEQSLPPAGIRALAKLVAVRANQAALNGDWEEAYAWNVRIHAMADHLCQPPFVVYHMVGMSLDRLGFEQLLVLFRKSPPRDAASIIAALKAGDDLRCSDDKADEAEALSFLDYLEDWYAWRDDPASRPHIGEIVQIFVGPSSSSIMDDLKDVLPDARAQPFKSQGDLRDAMRKSSLDEEWRTYAKLCAITSEWNELPFAQAWRREKEFCDRYCEAASSPVLSLISCTFLPPSQYRYLYAMTDSQRAAVETVGLLLQYRSRHGAWPDKLDALLPEFAERLLIDPFSGEPLAYRRNDDASDFVLYSVAANQKDDGGRHDQDWREADFVFWPHQPVTPVTK